MSFKKILSNYSKDVKLLKDVEKEIIKNDRNLEKLKKPVFDFDISDDPNISSEDLFRDFVKIKIKAQHSLNLLRNKKYFKNTSQNLIVKDLSIDSFDHIIHNETPSLDEVTKVVLQYDVLFHALSKTEEARITNGYKDSEVFLKNSQISRKRPSVCLYCDTKLSDNDNVCPVCESKIQYEELPFPKITNNSDTINNHKKHVLEDNSSCDESFSDDRFHETIKIDPTTRSPLKYSSIYGKKTNVDLNPNISGNLCIGSTLKEKNKVGKKLVVCKWTCFYCNRINYEDDLKCNTCLTLQKESKKNAISNENEKAKRTNNKNTKQGTKENHLSFSLPEYNQSRLSFETEERQNSSLVVPEKNIKISKNIVSEKNNTYPAQKSKVCDWVCTKCNFSNINIDINCITCLICLLEGKPPSENLEKKQEENNKKENNTGVTCTTKNELEENKRIRNNNFQGQKNNCFNISEVSLESSSSVDEGKTQCRYVAPEIKEIVNKGNENRKQPNDTRSNITKNVSIPNSNEKKRVSLEEVQYPSNRSTIMNKENESKGNHNDNMKKRPLTYDKKHNGTSLDISKHTSNTATYNRTCQEGLERSMENYDVPQVKIICNRVEYIPDKKGSDMREDTTFNNGSKMISRGAECRVKQYDGSGRKENKLVATSGGQNPRIEKEKETKERSIMNITTRDSGERGVNEHNTFQSLTSPDSQKYQFSRSHNTEDNLKVSSKKGKVKKCCIPSCCCFPKKHSKMSKSSCS